MSANTADDKRQAAREVIDILHEISTLLVCLRAASSPQKLCDRIRRGSVPRPPLDPADGLLF